MRGQHDVLYLTTETAEPHLALIVYNTTKAVTATMKTLMVVTMESVVELLFKVEGPGATSIDGAAFAADCVPFFVAHLTLPATGQSTPVAASPLSQMH